MAKFYDLNLDDGVIDAITMMGYDEPTPVQEAVIPLILNDHDLIACAQTGTGKTAAFLLPLISKIMLTEDDGNVSAIIISPTRELAQQIDQQLQGFAYYAEVSSIAIYGGNAGQDYDQEKKALSKGADIIIATPGRLKSHLVHSYAKLDKLKYLVLDEADRMLDMGFIDDIKQIISKLPKERQTLLFSATMPNDIRKLAKDILNDPKEINLSLSKPAEGVLQAAYVLHETQKLPLVVHLLKDKDLPRILVFASTKVDVKSLHKELRRAGLDANAIHSDLSQPEREDVLNKFKAGLVPILVATDVVSRGIDVQNIDLVINYNVPGDAEDYVHRIGRTARAKSSGVAITLVNNEDMFRLGKIEKLIESEVFKCPMPEGFEPGPEYRSNPPQRKKGFKNYKGKGGKKPYRSKK